MGLMKLVCNREVKSIVLFSNNTLQMYPSLLFRDFFNRGLFNIDNNGIFLYSYLKKQYYELNIHGQLQIVGVDIID
jgi:hypothetical protein